MRNVLGTNTNRGDPDYKTEPYIEIGAENYCYKCWPRNINGFHDRGEQYLFLFTTCRREGTKQFGERYVVGHIKRAGFGRNSNGGWAVIGPTKLYAFKDAFPLADIRDNSEQPRRVRKILTSKEVARVLHHFNGKTNILEDCRNEIRKLRRRLPLREKR